MPGNASRENGKKGGRPPGVVEKRILALRARLLRDEELSVESTIEAIRRGQQYDIRQLLDEHGNFKSLQDLTEEEAWCIAGAEIIIKNAAAGDGHTDRVLKVKFMDRGRYVELAARHQGMLHDKLDVNVTDVGAKLDAAREVDRQRNARKGQQK